MLNTNSLLTKSSLGFLFMLYAVACSSEGSTPAPRPQPDSGVPSTSADTSSHDSGTSGASNTTSSGASDAGPSTSGMSDAGATATSVAVDAGEDTPASETDGGNDTEPTSGDAGETSGDSGGVPDPWAACPEAVVPQNEAWPVSVRATEGAVYCAMFNENRTLLEEKAAKLQLRIAPGVHRLPDVDTDSLALPACIRDGVDTSSVVGGNLTVVKTPGEGNTSYALGVRQEFGQGDARRLQMSLQQTFDDSAPIEFLLDGAEVESLESYQSMDLCEEEGEYCLPNIIFTSCAYESGELNTHSVEFAGGEVTFDLRIGESFAGTEPGAFVSAHGSYLGESFAQTDYFKLIYHPAHHHFERAFVVLFDEPHNDVCGIEVSGLEPFGDDVPDTAFALNCDLDHVTELEVISHTLVRSSQ